MEFSEEEIELWENGTLGADPDFVVVSSRQIKKGEIKMTNSLFDEVNVAVNEVSGMANEVSNIIYTKENLFRRLVSLQEQMETIKADIKAVKEDFTQSEDNPNGLDKAVVKEIAAFAVKYVTEKVDAVIEQGAVFEALKDELVG